MQPAAFATGHDFIPLPSKPVSFPAGKAAPGANGQTAAALAAPPAPAQNCPPPKVTLQRQGEVVSGIRIQCGCGRVIELSCVY